MPHVHLGDGNGTADGQTELPDAFFNTNGRGGGIGTNAPGEKLDVVGDVRASESVICGEYTVATASDLAANVAGAEIYLSSGAAGNPAKALSDNTS